MGLGFRIWDHGSAWSAPCWCPARGPPPGPPVTTSSVLAKRERKAKPRQHRTGLLGQCCGTGKFIPRILIFFHPGSRISDPTTAKKRWWEKFCLSYLFFGAKNFTTLNEKVQKKVWTNWQSIKIFLTLKKCYKTLRKISLGFGIRDPGSGKNLSQIQGPWVKKQPIPDLGPQLSTVL